MTKVDFDRPLHFVALLVSAVLTTVIPAQPTTRATTRPQSPVSKPEWQAAVLQSARAFVASKVFKLQHRDDHDRFRVATATLANHPLLRDLLPKHRFYVVQVHSVHDKEFNGKIYPAPYMTFYMARVDTPTGEAHFTDRGNSVGNESYRFDAIRFLQDNNVRAKTKADTKQIFLLCRTLRRLARGGGMPVLTTVKHVDQVTINKHIALGLPRPFKPSIKQQQIHVAASKTRFYATVVSQHCDDWNLPVTARFRWLEFDKKTHLILGERQAKGKTWPSVQFNEKVFGQEVERFMRELAKRD